jgi:hypothetical protein
MAERLSIIRERVDDIPLLLAQLERMGVRSLLNEYFPAHGNWVGLSVGWVAELWLTHILSEADHRLNHVEPWTEQRLHTLQMLDRGLSPVSAATKKLWRQYHLTYDQTRYVAKEVRRTLSIERANTRTRAGARLSRDEEKRLIAHAYRVKGTHGLLVLCFCVWLTENR